jgi:HPt (histidine-containing phosphotransfer) domain-containing protein
VSAAAPATDLPRPDFDPAELMRRLGGDQEILVEALRMFLEGPSRVDDMRTALARTDYTALAKLAHTVRGVSLTVSAVRLAQAATTLETHARNASARECAEHIDAIADAQRAARTAIAAHLNALRAAPPA